MTDCYQERQRRSRSATEDGDIDDMYSALPVRENLGAKIYDQAVPWRYCDTDGQQLDSYLESLHEPVFLGEENNANSIKGQQPAWSEQRLMGMLLAWSITNSRCITGMGS